MWNTAHIFWREQLMILSILLPPIFISMILLAINAPRLFGSKQIDKREAKKTRRASSHPLAQSR